MKREGGIVTLEVGDVMEALSPFLDRIYRLLAEAEYEAVPLSEQVVRIPLNGARLFGRRVEA